MTHDKKPYTILKLYKCQWCGTEFTKNHNRETYCKETCKKEARREQKREYRLNHYNTYYKKQRIQTFADYKKNLGTGSLGSHMIKDLEIELEKIESEMKRLKLKT